MPKPRRNYLPDITTSFDGLIVYKTIHSPGRRHHSKIYKMKHPTSSDGLPYGNEANSRKFCRDHLRHYDDTAYNVMGKVIPRLDHATLFKCRPGRDLTLEQRA